MIGLIGLTLEEACRCLDEKNLEYEVCENISDKQTSWDKRLVVNAVYDDKVNKYILTVSSFLMEVREEI